MRERRLPFRADKTLKSELKYEYIMPALQWLCHGADTHRIVSMELGSNWAVGYTIICVLRARDLFISDGSFSGQFDAKLDATVQYLISRVSWEKETCHWDGVLYDTAIISRALILYRRTVPHSNNLKRMNEIIHKSACWICDKILGWGYERYPLGIAELAEALRTMSCFQEYYPRESDEVLSKYKESLGEECIPEYLARRIVESREHFQLSANSESSVPGADLIRWESLLGTARVLIALESYLSEDKPLWNQAVREEVSTIVRKAVQYLEMSQQGGNWGEEVNTAVVLQGYLRAFEILGRPCLPQPGTVFQALRWLCDENQRFPDGSIVHHIEATIDFVLALLDTCYCWHLPEDLLDANVLDLYDYVIWHTAFRPTWERHRVIQLESQLHLQSLKERMLHERIAVQESILQRWKKGIFFATCALVFLFAGFMSGSIYLQPIRTTEIYIPTLSVTQWEVLLGIVTLIGTAAAFVYSRLFGLGEKHERSETR